MSIENNTIALAGIFQASELVRQIARQGMLDQAPFEASIQSVLKINADSITDVYGGLGGIKTGLQVLCQQLGNETKRNIEVMQYVLGVVFLERKLAKRQDMLAKIRIGIETAVAETEIYAATHPQVVEQLANLYTQTLSTFDYRIKVGGEQRFLENPHNADKIRALLLAGIRSAVLWRQKGGKRLQFIFSRAKILRTAQDLLGMTKNLS
jgi:high frequency lysogenization protein